MLYSYDHPSQAPPPFGLHHVVSHPNEGSRPGEQIPMEAAQGMMKGQIGPPRGCAPPHENGSMESYRGHTMYYSGPHSIPPHPSHRASHPPPPMYPSEQMHYYPRPMAHHPQGRYQPHLSQPPRFSHPHHRVHSTVPPPPPPPPPRAVPQDSYYGERVSLEPRLEPQTGAPPPPSYGGSNQNVLLERLIDTHFRIGGCTCKKSRCLKLYCQCFASSTTCGAKCKCQACHNTTANADLIEDARKTILERNPSAFDDKFRATMATSNPQQQQTQTQTHSVIRHPYAPKAIPSSVQTNLTTVESTMSTCPSQAKSVSSPTSAKSSVSLAVAWGNAPPAKSSPSRVNKYGCKCRRSFCLKKYCECFQNSVYCGLNCRCSHCKNFSPEDKSPAKSVSVVTTTAQSNSSPVEKVSPAVVERESPARVVSADSTETVVEDIKHGSPRADRMAIMAAVAMTELFGGKLSSSDAQEQLSHDMSNKRKMQEESGVTTIVCKRSKPATESPSSLADEEVRAVVSSSNSMESRNNSPVALIQPPSSTNPHAPLTASYPRPQPRSSGLCHQATSKTTTSYYAPLRQQVSPSTMRASPTYRSSPSYEDVVRSSGLPKSLSFRKICSKCGKTRAEHGELGFGNKCVYQDCGKCGAGVQMHRKAHCPMGILCTLSVEDGAIPGSADAYERKIKDLAARAELQRSLMQRKDQQRVASTATVVMNATSS